jgi:hypothetical protein
LGNRGNPYVTVVAVWLASALGLALVASFPISSVVFFSAILLLILAVGYVAYKAFRHELRIRNLGRDLFSGLRRFIVKVSEDFGLVFGRVSAWWLRREARIREEMAQEQERNARRKEKLAQWKQKRRARPLDEHPATGEREAVRRGSQEKRTEG